MKITKTKLIVIINVIIFLITSSYQNITLNLAVWPITSEYFQIYQFVTHMFVHSNFAHLFLNMIILIMFGELIEKNLKNNFILFYIICGVGASIIQMIFGLGIPMVGASGAIFGIIVLYTILKPNQKVYLLFLIPLKLKYALFIILGLEIYQVFLPIFDNIGHYAHLGGALTALLYFLISNKLNFKLVRK